MVVVTAARWAYCWVDVLVAYLASSSAVLRVAYLAWKLAAESAVCLVEHWVGD